MPTPARSLDDRIRLKERSGSLTQRDLERAGQALPSGLGSLCEGSHCIAELGDGDGYGYGYGNGDGYGYGNGYGYGYGNGYGNGDGDGYGNGDGYGYGYGHGYGGNS